MNETFKEMKANRKQHVSKLLVLCFLCCVRQPYQHKK